MITGELDAANAEMEASRQERWRAELPKIRADLLDSSFVSREAVLDGIVTAQEIEALGFQQEPPYSCQDGWVRRGFF
jgi:hypothetical protein